MIKTLVLAAGRGSRLRSNTPKVLHKIFDKPILAWVLDSLAEVDQDEIMVVCGHKKEVVKDFLHAYPVETIDQDEPMGTGHAVLCAQDSLENFDGTLLVVNGDTPLINSDTINAMLRSHHNNASHMTLLTCKVDDPYGYGRIIKRNGKIISIKEDKDCSEPEQAINEINCGTYLLEWQFVKEGLKRLSSNNAQEEYYLTDLVEWCYRQGLKITHHNLKDPYEAKGVNNREDIAKVYEYKNKQTLKRLMENGVTIVDPSSTLISPDADIGHDTTILPGTFIQRRVTIGHNCQIGPNTVINGPAEIGAHSIVNSSQISRSSVGEHSNIGPYANIRFGSDISHHTRIGSFVEVKNSIIDEYTAAAHLAYLGDAHIKSNVNIGAGTVTANYDALSGEKSTTVISKNVNTGANSVLIAPIKIGEGSAVAAGSVITDDVPADSLAIARPRQQIKNLPVRNKSTAK
jgi:bifunctional UDP-N-acetylglucosamine pyrophosphorylase/glucosamine-1-phosphate N-acetyltransferase